uniref:Uncharacterized protein n=1 Tax=Solanum lycopersicum TaxID=4081 RepID=A0A3Q7G4A1_SOLLC
MIVVDEAVEKEAIFKVPRIISVSTQYTHACTHARTHEHGHTLMLSFQ